MLGPEQGFPYTWRKTGICLVVTGTLEKNLLSTNDQFLSGLTIAPPVDPLPLYRDFSNQRYLTIPVSDTTGSFEVTFNRCVLFNNKHFSLHGDRQAF
jgi:hypothetical protein